MLLLACTISTEADDSIESVYDKKKDTEDRATTYCSNSSLSFFSLTNRSFFTRLQHTTSSRDQRLIMPVFNGKRGDKCWTVTLVSSKFAQTYLRIQGFFKDFQELPSTLSDFKHLQGPWSFYSRFKDFSSTLWTLQCRLCHTNHCTDSKQE